MTSKTKQKAKPKPEPKPKTPDETFERVSARVVEAIEALNDALKEAHKQTNMTVGMGIVGTDERHPRWPWKPETPASLTYHIARITKCSMALTVTEADPVVWKMKYVAQLDDSEESAPA